jgi:hypothetical protein
MSSDSTDPADMKSDPADKLIDDIHRLRTSA